MMSRGILLFHKVYHNLGFTFVCVYNLIKYSLWLQIDFTCSTEKNSTLLNSRSS